MPTCILPLKLIETMRRALETNRNYEKNFGLSCDWASTQLYHFFYKDKKKTQLTLGYILYTQVDKWQSIHSCKAVILKIRFDKHWWVLGLLFVQVPFYNYGWLMHCYIHLFHLVNTKISELAEFTEDEYKTSGCHWMLQNAHCTERAGFP